MRYGMPYSSMTSCLLRDDAVFQASGALPLVEIGGNEVELSVIKGIATGVVTFIYLIQGFLYALVVFELEYIDVS